MYGPGFTPQTPRPAADAAPPVQTVSTVEWFFAILLMAIPLVNLIFLLVWAFGDGINPNKGDLGEGGAALDGDLVCALALLFLDCDECPHHSDS